MDRRHAARRIPHGPSADGGPAHGRGPRRWAAAAAAATLAASLAAVPTVGASPGGTGAGSPGGRGSYIVRPGDSVPAVARRTGVSPDDLRVANGIVGDRLYAGARLVIDPGAAAGGAPSAPALAATPTAGGGTYVVQRGDALSTIARRHGVGLRALLAANGLRTTSVILPGRRLVIPGGGGVAVRTVTAPAAPARGTGPVIRCPVPGAGFMNDWGFPRGTTRFHEGTDLFAPRGTPVRSPLTGTVAFGSNPLGGVTFTVTSPTGWVAYGAHLSGTVGASRWVAAGEVIATVGSSGNAAGGDTHLHLGLRRGTAPPVNPYPSVAAAC